MCIFILKSQNQKCHQESRSKCSLIHATHSTIMPRIHDKPLFSSGHGVITCAFSSDVSLSYMLTAFAILKAGGQCLHLLTPQSFSCLGICSEVSKFKCLYFVDAD